MGLALAGIGLGEVSSGAGRIPDLKICLLNWVPLLSRLSRSRSPSLVIG